VIRQEWFKPLRSRPRVRRICAFDVEGRGGPGGFVCGAVVSEAGSEFYLDPESMFRSLLDHGARGEWIFAHNLEYDLPIVAGGRLLEGDLLFKSLGMLWATYPAGERKARFYDSTNLFPRRWVTWQLCLSWRSHTICSPAWRTRPRGSILRHRSRLIREHTVSATLRLCMLLLGFSRRN
jgi:hypothetical protein